MKQLVVIMRVFPTPENPSLSITFVICMGFICILHGWAGLGWVEMEAFGYVVGMRESE